MTLKEFLIQASPRVATIRVRYTLQVEYDGVVYYGFSGNYRYCDSLGGGLRGRH
jgi:hypothetical protein